MGTPLNTIEKAMKDLLEANSGFMTACKGGVHNWVPEKPTYPYARLGDAFEQKFNTFGRNGKTTEVVLHIFSQYNGDYEAQNLVNLADNILDDATLNLTGWTPVLISWESTEIVTDDDGRTKHTMVIYRIITQEG